MSIKKLSYPSKIHIAKFADDHLHPSGQHIALTDKQLKNFGRQEEVDQILQRIKLEKDKKKQFIRQLEQIDDIVDYLLWKKLTKKLKIYIAQEGSQDSFSMLPLVRKPNYYKYLDEEFSEYLNEHPYSKKIRISGWRNDILFFLTFQHHGRSALVAIHIPLPNPIPNDFNIYDNHHLRDFVLHSQQAVISDYTILH